MVVQAHRECYPHYSKETPEIYKKVAEEFVADCYNLEEYDRETFIMRRRVGTMNDHVAPIYERHLQNPHIKFFNERNADWKKVHFCVHVIHLPLDTTSISLYLPSFSLPPTSYFCLLSVCLSVCLFV